jgi:hypothetical protein
VADGSRDFRSKETRRSNRARALLQARLSYGDGAISTECTVNQLSDIGARMNVASSVALPDMFEIAVPQRGMSRRAKLVWRKDDQVGVDFLDEPDAPLAAASDDAPARVKALEAENARLKARISALLQQVQRLTEE